MKTRDRILQTSLQLFNEHGEPRITTNHIADELEISPGNLYYHFRNKDDIIEQLFARFEERIGDALLVPEGRMPNLEDMWLQMHLVFECIWDYRFVYRDLVDLLTRSRKLKMHFSRILKRAHESISKVYTEMVKAGTFLRDMRVATTDTCINHQTVYQPKLGEHVAWGDTGTVIYANSVFGARSNFESGPAALSAGLTGRTPAYGFHLDEHRKGTFTVEVTARLDDLADFTRGQAKRTKNPEFLDQVAAYESDAEFLRTLILPEPPVGAAKA